MIITVTEIMDVLEGFPVKLRERRVYQSGSMIYLMIAVIIGMLVTTIVQAESDQEGASINYIPGSLYKDFLKYNVVDRNRDENASRRNTWLSPYNFDSSLTEGIYSLRISPYTNSENQHDGYIPGNTALILGLGYNKEYRSNGYSSHDNSEDMLFGLSRDQYKLQGPLFFMSVDHRW